MIKLEKIVDLLQTTILDISPYSLVAIDQSGESFKECFLVDIGVNSIDYAEIVTVVMEIMHIDIPLRYFYKVNKVIDVAEILYASQDLSYEVYKEISI